MSAEANAAPSPVIREDRDEQGAVVARYAMAGGVLQGRMERFFPSGKPEVVAHFVRGRLHGVMQAYDTQGRLQQVAEFADGVQEGITRLYAQGALLSEQTYRAGVLHGPCVSYDGAGQVSSRLNYVDGEIEGVAEFFMEGRPVRRARYRKGLLEGESQDLDLQGRLTQSSPYVANRLEGTVRRYWPSGAVMQEVSYRQGRPVGEPRQFPDDAAGATGVAQVAWFDRLVAWLRGG